MRVALTVLAVLGLVATANASIVLQVDPGVDVGGGLTSYTVRLVSDTADGATAWDGSFNGPMNQVLELGVIPTPTLTRAIAPLPNEAQDSHFLFLNDNLLIETAPYETDIKLAGVFGIKPAYTLQSLPLAQIVLAPGANVWVSGHATDASGAIFNTSTFPYHSPPSADADGPYVINEGDTLTLDASGSLGDPYYDIDIISYKWDLDDDGVYETDAGDQPVFSADYAYLESLGLGVCDPGESYDIHLMVEDTYYYSDYDHSTLTIIPEPASLSLLALGGLAVLRRRR